MTMLKDASSTLQGMIDSVSPGTGNMYNGIPVNQPVQTPYPSPKDMVMNAGIYGNPGYQPAYMGYPQQPMGYPQPSTGYPQVMGQPMNDFQTPRNMVVNINGVPTELEYNPNAFDYSHEPENTIELSTGGFACNPGRYMQQPMTQSDLMYSQARSEQLQYGRNFVGGYNEYGTVSPPPIQYGHNFQYCMDPVTTITPNVQGVVNVYAGRLIHPHVNDGWYGSPEFPFENVAKKSLEQVDLQQSMRDRFNAKFPEYNNPYANPGFMQQPQTPMVTVTREMQDMANIAAFYGMTYNEFMDNDVKINKMLTRLSGKYVGLDEEEIEKNVNAIKRTDVKTVLNERSLRDESIEDDGTLFYPNGSFDSRGQLTREYQTMFCINRKRLRENRAKLKVVVSFGDKKVECTRRPIDIATNLEQMDKWFNNNRNYQIMKEQNRQRMIAMYMNAPERQIDNIEGNVFQVTTKSLAFAKQKELDRMLRQQQHTMSSTLYNRGNFLYEIKAIRERNKAYKKKLDDAKFSELVHRVAGAREDRPAPAYKECPFIVDGDWVIAKPGVDVVGLPLDQSVNKIVAFNTATGEEEIYDPNKMTGLEVRERIIESMNPPFSEIDDDELVNRLERFSTTGFKNYTDV